MVQERRALLMDSLRKYFTGRGYREVTPPGSLDIAFENGRRRVGIKLLSYSSNPVKDQKVVRGYIYRFLREKPCDEVYFAVEEVWYSHLPRSEEFKESGMGLLRLLEDRVEIAIPAAPFEGGESVQTPVKHALAGEEKGFANKTQLTEDFLLRELERRVEELLERKFTEYLRKRTERTSNALEVELSQQVPPTQQGAPAQAQNDFSLPVGSALPDIEFLKGNPWLEALMRRGGE